MGLIIKSVEGDMVKKKNKKSDKKPSKTIQNKEWKKNKNE